MNDPGRPGSEWPPDWRSADHTRVFSDHEQRRRGRALQQRLRDRDLGAAVLAQSRNVLYFGGIAAQGYVVVPADGEPQFLVQIDPERAAALSSLRVRPSRGVSTLVETLTSLGLGSAAIGVEKGSLPVSVLERLADRLPGVRWADVGPDVLALRMVKSQEEISWLRVAARISDMLLAELTTLLRPGVSEIDLYGHLALRGRQLGADGLSAKHGFNDRTIEHAWLVSGPNTSRVSGYWLTMTGLGPSPARPYGPTRRVIEKGDLVCYDAGTPVNGYHSDHARTFVVGEASPKQLGLWEALLEVQRHAVAAAQPGRTAADVYDAAARAAAEHGITEHFMTRATLDFPYVGHGVGVEIDEPPLLSPRDRTVLQPGMVLAIEPKVIIPGWGGLTVEDTVLVTTGAPEVLTLAPTQLEVPLTS